MDSPLSTGCDEPFVTFCSSGTGFLGFSFSRSDCSRAEISDSRSFSTSCRRIISCSKLCTDLSLGLTLRDNAGREKEDRETELLVLWLEIEALRDLAEDSSCESETDCETDLQSNVR